MPAAKIWKQMAALRPPGRDVIHFNPLEWMELFLLRKRSDKSVVSCRSHSSDKSAALPAWKQGSLFLQRGARKLFCSAGCVQFAGFGGRSGFWLFPQLCVCVLLNCGVRKIHTRQGDKKIWFWSTHAVWDKWFSLQLISHQSQRCFQAGFGN
jgi:hypothetical protein